MAEKLCELKKKGGGGAKQTETVLWTNPSPNSTFAAQAVTLSDSIDNYDYIAIDWKVVATSITSARAIIPVVDFVSMNNQNGNNSILIAGISTSGYGRGVIHVSDTTITITDSYRINASGTNNGVDIPLSIIGIKDMGGKIDNKTVSGSVSVTAGGATSTIDVGFRPKKLYLYAYISSTGIITCAYDESVSPNGYIRGLLYGSNKIDDMVAFGNSNGIASIEDTGFKIYCNLSQLVGTWHYTAIKE